MVPSNVAKKVIGMAGVLPLHVLRLLDVMRIFQRSRLKKPMMKMTWMIFQKMPKDRAPVKLTWRPNQAIRHHCYVFPILLQLIDVWVSLSLGDSGGSRCRSGRGEMQ